jgi:DNA helicase INO80
MDRAHRLGQTRQVTVYRLITRGTIEERIRKRALQKEEVQRVVITGQAGAGVDFNNRSTRENNRTKDIAMWLADDDQAAAIEQREAELAEQEARDGGKKKRKSTAAKKKEVSMDDMYHEGPYSLTTVRRLSSTKD